MYNHADRNKSVLKFLDHFLYFLLIDIMHCAKYIKEDHTNSSDYDIRTLKYSHNFSKNVEVILKAQKIPHPKMKLMVKILQRKTKMTKNQQLPEWSTGLAIFSLP